MHYDSTGKTQLLASSWCSGPSCVCVCIFCMCVCVCVFIKQKYLWPPIKKKKFLQYITENNYWKYFMIFWNTYKTWLIHAGKKKAEKLTNKQKTVKLQIRHHSWVEHNTAKLWLSWKNRRKLTVCSTALL